MSDIFGTVAEVPLRYAEDAGSDLTKLAQRGAVTSYDEPGEAAKSSHFETDNAKAVPVFERAALSHYTGAAQVNGTQMLLGRRAGRKYVVLSVPNSYIPLGSTVASTPNGVMVDDDRSGLDTSSGYQLNAGDSLEIDSEAPIWVGLLPGLTSGVVQFSEAFSPLGGPVGG